MKPMDKRIRTKTVVPAIPTEKMVVRKLSNNKKTIQVERKVNGKAAKNNSTPGLILDISFARSRSMDKKIRAMIVAKTAETRKILTFSQNDKISMKDDLVKKKDPFHKYKKVGKEDQFHTRFDHEIFPERRPIFCALVMAHLRYSFWGNALS
jgi:hypothetical protein